jgi:hypothetical protein
MLRSSPGQFIVYTFRSRSRRVRGDAVEVPLAIIDLYGWIWENRSHAATGESAALVVRYVTVC